MVTITGRFFAIIAGFGKTPLCKGKFWCSAKLHNTHYTERCIEVRPYCSTNWNLIISTSRLLHLQGFADSQKTVLHGSRRKLSDELADKTGVSLCHFL